MNAIYKRSLYLVLGITTATIALGSSSVVAETQSQPVKSENWQHSILELPSPTTQLFSTQPNAQVTPSVDETLIGQEDFIEEIEEIEPARATRSSPSYIGIGGNIGIGDGDSNLGEGSFWVFSKLGLLPYLSVRPSLAIEDSVTILLPVTFDFIPGITEFTEEATEELGLRISPYVGAGIAINTEDEAEVDFLATGGVDVPLSEQFTATAAVSATLFDDPAVGLQLGVGYNFR